MQDAKIISGLIVLLLCMAASYKEFQGKKNYTVCFSEILLGIVLALAVVYW